VGAAGDGIGVGVGGHIFFGPGDNMKGESRFHSVFIPQGWSIIWFEVAIKIQWRITRIS